MLARLTGALAAALFVVSFAPAAAVAQAQGDRLPRSVQRVIDDFRADGAITPCKHTARALTRTGELPPADLEKESPDFQSAVAAALEERRRANCAGEQPAEGSQADGGGGASSGNGGSAGAQPTGGAPATASPEPGATPAGSQPAPAATAAPPAATPAAPVPAVPAPAATPAATVYRAVDTDDPFPVALLALGALLALAAPAALAFALAARLGWGGERMARARHAWGEARYRAGAVGADFGDWLRLGR